MYFVEKTNAQELNSFLYGFPSKFNIKFFSTRKMQSTSDQFCSSTEVAQVEKVQFVLNYFQILAEHSQ